MSDLKDFKNKNTEFTGTKGIDLPEGTEAQRVDGQGILRFNTDTNLAEYYDGTSWKPIDSPPTITGVSPASWISDGSTLQTFTVSGSNFQTGATAKFVGSDGTEYTSVNLNVVSSSSFTIQNMTTMSVAKEPYDIIFTNPSGLAATLEDAIDAGNNPAFATAADTNVATLWEGKAAPFSETTLVATDSTDSQTVTHSISAGDLPPGVTISSAGVLGGTVSGSSIQDYTFTVRASDGFNTVDRQFVITVSANPFITASGGNTTLTSGDFKTHIFTSPGTFAVSAAGAPTGSNSVEYIVIAGGAGGSGGHGGGGGAGGMRFNYPSPAIGGFPISATSYPITVGGGGNGGVNPRPSPAILGQSGGNSVFSSITSAGGGGGAYSNNDGFPNDQGVPGGSGGGGGSAGGGSGNTPPVSPPQGNPGAGGSPGGSPVYQGGGGGGRGSAGSSNGTSGIGQSISPTFFGPTAPSYGTGGPAPGRYLAGGGGGGIHQGPVPVGSAQAGGGGDGGTNGPSPVRGQNGTANTGGGGGGTQGPGPRGGDGGSGIVAIRYKFQ